VSLLILGRQGQLARALSEALPDAQALGRETLDLADTAAIAPALLAMRPRAIVNAAGWTAVDLAECEPAAAWRLNASAVAEIAAAAAELGIPLVHISTDYVFDGLATAEYPPDAPARPLGAYGRSKLAGELAAATLCPQHWILRTSWVFSHMGTNFLRTMLRLGGEREHLRVVADQFGRPTAAEDLGALIASLLAAIEAGRAPPPGVYHATGGPVVSWHGFAEAIFREAVACGLLERAPAVEAIATVDYPTPAPRPLRAVLAPSEALLGPGAAAPDWTRALPRSLARIHELARGARPPADLVRS